MKEPDYLTFASYESTGNALGLAKAWECTVNRRRNGHRTRLATRQWGPLHSPHSISHATCQAHKGRARLLGEGDQRMSTASKTADRKAAHPELYCPHTRCLWNTGGALCHRHAKALATGKPIAPYIAQAQRIANAYNTIAEQERRVDLEE